MPLISCQCGNLIELGLQEAVAAKYCPECKTRFYVPSLRTLRNVDQPIHVIPDESFTVVTNPSLQLLKDLVTAEAITNPADELSAPEHTGGAYSDQFDGTFDGFCPECQVHGTGSPIKVNNKDTYECQTCNLRLWPDGPAVVLLRKRDKGEFDRKGYPWNGGQKKIAVATHENPRLMGELLSHGHAKVIESKEELVEFLPTVVPSEFDN